MFLLAMSGRFDHRQPDAVLDPTQGIEELAFSKHSISSQEGQLILRLNVPYNYYELDDFEFKAIELLGIDKNWLIDMSLEDSHCTHQLTK